MSKHLYKILPVALILTLLLVIALNGKMEEPKTVTQEIQELANEWKPDWSDYGQIKYYIVWDHSLGQPAIVGTIKNQAYGVSYFETASQAGEAMLYLGDKLRVLK